MARRSAQLLPIAVEGAASLGTSCRLDVVISDHSHPHTSPLALHAQVAKTMSRGDLRKDLDRLTVRVRRQGPCHLFLSTSWMDGILVGQ